MAGSPSGEVGSSGLRTSSGGYVLEELNPKLFGREAILTWRSMRDNDAVVGAIMFAIDMLVRQVEWRVDKGDVKDADAEFLEQCMDDMSMSWGDFISEALSMLPFGFAPLEIVYKKRQGPSKGTGPGATPSSKYTDGKIGWRKLPLRAQETLDHWEFDDDGGLQAFVQKPPPNYQDIVIPMEKILLFRTTVHKNNPEGRSVLRSAYTSWFYKKRIQAIEGTGIERDLAGFPVFWLPAELLSDSATPEQKAVVAAFDQIGKNIRRDKQEYLLMPQAFDEAGNKAFDFTLTSSGGARTFDTSAVIARYNQEIAMSVLADFILLGHEAVGSFALSSDKSNLFAVAMGTFLDIIKDVMNRYAVPRLFALNGMDLENLPSIEHGDVSDPDLTALAAYLSALVTAGAPLFPDEELENFLRKIGGLPEKSEEAKQAQEEAANAAQQQQQQQFGADGGQPGGGGGGDLTSLIQEARAARGGSAGSSPPSSSGGTPPPAGQQGSNF